MLSDAVSSSLAIAASLEGGGGVGGRIRVKVASVGGAYGGGAVVVGETKAFCRGVSIESRRAGTGGGSGGSGGGGATRGGDVAAVRRRVSV